MTAEEIRDPALFDSNVVISFLAGYFRTASLLVLLLDGSSPMVRVWRPTRLTRFVEE